MKKLRRAIAAAGGLMLLAATAAGAITVNAEGGQWDYGTSDTLVWSNYYHSAVRHGASVEGAAYIDSGCVAPAQWARASVGVKPTWQVWKRNQSFYRHC